MDHSISIAVLKDELDDCRAKADYLSSGIATMMIGKHGGQRFREDSLMRWRKKLEAQQVKIHSIRGTIKFLEHHSLGGK